MEKDYQSIKNFLEETNSFESFLESDSLVWIDHREYDEDIISYFNTKIGNKIEVNLQDNGKSYGEDIYLKYKGKSVMIPYEENMDRDTTIIWTNEIIKDDFSIRLFVEEKGYDAFGFCLLANDEWDLLEKEFGKTLLNKYFFKINLS
ncbi:MAG: glutathione reductase, partial [Fusobacterium gastrosuis]|uniref:glutathione reductase n=2 Tax=Fusobacterium TaxID=848 RepID=UPI002A874856|nr:glutathione reductase [Fusobacterium gastrosuis]